MVRMHNMPTLEKHYTVAVCDLRGAGLAPQVSALP